MKEFVSRFSGPILDIYCFGASSCMCLISSLNAMENQSHQMEKGGLHKLSLKNSNAKSCLLWALFTLIIHLGKVGHL